MKKLIFFILFASLLFIGCSDEKKGAAAAVQPAQMPPVSVKEYLVKFDKANFAKSYSAMLKPFKEVEIVARVSGVLVKENFTEGAFVRKGDTLYVIQQDEYKATLDESKASLLKANANFNKALKDWNRAEFLFKNSAISEQQRDELMYAYESAKAEVQKIEATLKNAELNYGYTTIKAPIDGIVGLSGSDVGSYIDVGAQNSKLTTITALEQVYAEFSIPNSDISKYPSQIKNGAKVTLNISSKAYNGVVDFISPKLDSQTDTLLLRAKFQNQNRELIIGSYVEVNLDGFSYEKVAKIPQNALVKTPAEILVYVIENDSIVMKPVKVLDVHDGMAMIESGVDENERIVISNIAKLKPNSKVTVMDEK